MSGWDLLYYLFALLYVILLPSYALGKIFLPRERLAVRMFLGVALSLTATAAITFGVSMVLGTNMSQPMLFAVATAVIIAGGVVQLFRKKKTSQELED